jgi:hypothetical protein
VYAGVWCSICMCVREYVYARVWCSIWSKETYFRVKRDLILAHSFVQCVWSWQRTSAPSLKDLCSLSYSPSHTQLQVHTHTHTHVKIIGVLFAGGLIALSEEGMLLGVGTDARVYARLQV